MADALGTDAVLKVDSTDQVGVILELHRQLRAGLNLFTEAKLDSLDHVRNVVIAGMGGSGIGGQLALAVIADRVAKPVVTVSGYELPAWVGVDTLVITPSYSGETEETLQCFEQAKVRSAMRVAVTTGGTLAELALRDGVPLIELPPGFQPRASVGYGTVAMLELLSCAGCAPSSRSEIVSAANLLEQLSSDWGPESSEDSLAKALAWRLHNTTPIVIGAELTQSVAYRWKCQFAENAKTPAFSATLPELDHNDLVAWTGAEEFSNFGVVFLADTGLHARVRKRFELTADFISARAGSVDMVAPQGESRVERLFSLVLLGDLVSLYLAVLRGVDPIAIDPIEELKAELARG